VDGRPIMVVVGAHFLLRCLDLERFVLYVVKVSSLHTAHCFFIDIAILEVLVLVSSFRYSVLLKDVDQHIGVYQLKFLMKSAFYGNSSLSGKC